MIRVHSFVVISGADAGAFYVRQLLRAVAAGQLETQRIVVVDRDPRCAAGRGQPPRVELAVADWADWLDAHLLDAGEGQLVPYHWAPHLLVEWLRRQAERAGFSASRGGPLPRFGLPFEHATRDGDRALSYATWPCPPACIEPALCPHTRGAKDWSLAGDMATAPAGFAAALVFRSLHLVYGVATIPLEVIRAARQRILLGAATGPQTYLVSTASHCHGLATVLSVRPRG